MRNIKMIIEFDGGRYKGWQKQTEDVNTVQGKIENVIEKMIGENVQLVGCGRSSCS